jgi:gas vesicle protein
MMTYNENIDYKKEFAKTVKEIRKNKPKLSREEKELLKFREQLKTSILEKGLLNKITLTNYGILDGEDRFRILQELKLVEVPPLTNDLFCKEFADKYPQYFAWKEVKDYKEFKELRVISSLSRKLRRKEIEEYCKLIEGTMPDNQIANFIVKKFSKYISNATLYRWIPSKYKHKQTFSNEKNLPEGMNILQKPETVTFSIRTTRSQKERFYELCKKHGLQVNDVIKQLIDEWIKKTSSAVTPSESGTVEQQPQEIKDLLNNSKELVQQHPIEVEHKVKEDYCGVCGKFTRFEWDSFNQQYVCVECKNKELSRVIKQSPSKIEIRKVGE